MQPVTTQTAIDLTPTPTRSALLGFLARIQPGQRYALYPAGNYTRACVEDLPPDALETEGRVLLGYIDDDPNLSKLLGKPVVSLTKAVDTWPLDALVILRDTHDGQLAQRIAKVGDQGRLASINVITQPVASLEAMAAHLGSYSPSCEYDPEFIGLCHRTNQAVANDCVTESTLLCTMDGEVFVGASAETVASYAVAMRELCNMLTEFGFSASLCVQLHDSKGVFLKTPDAVVETVIDILGPDAVELHGFDHTMPVEGYAVEWLARGLEELESRYGVTSHYWAPPGWTLNWRTLAALQQLPAIEAVRGIWSGVNTRQGRTLETMRFPYQVAGLWQIPYAYVDWMFMDYRCRPAQPADEIIGLHRQLAQFAAAGPCLMETVVHAFRLAGSNLDRKLDVVRETLALYAAHGVTLSKVAAARSLFNRSRC